MHSEITNMTPKSQNNSSQCGFISGATVMQLRINNALNEKKRQPIVTRRIFLFTFLNILTSSIAVAFSMP